jgi:uncharacterized protein YaaW (UPF0174 family)
MEEFFSLNTTFAQGSQKQSTSSNMFANWMSNNNITFTLSVSDKNSDFSVKIAKVSNRMEQHLSTK